jgi:hypothetical protein
MAWLITYVIVWHGARMFVQPEVLVPVGETYLHTPPFVGVHGGVEIQIPPWHVPPGHIAPFVRLTLSGQAALAPSHTSAASQDPAADLHTVDTEVNPQLELQQ